MYMCLCDCEIYRDVHVQLQLFFAMISIAYEFIVAITIELISQTFLLSWELTITCVIKSPIKFKTSHQPIFSMQEVLFFKLNLFKIKT